MSAVGRWWQRLAQADAPPVAAEADEHDYATLDAIREMEKGLLPMADTELVLVE